ncbi:tetratricopeptide repeat protein [Parerythrobacter lacustris]|uniref:Tetratricopeptide repeat protein n=1 Tax=Parerythrobacter lacustris TaxID=2969984 RepID=A0ABT1XQI9_9SPHN|nr:tetratricopeptide repeat protein [Parerythrobacter lacustris]MCR2833916.1 tetratricopeptide repeat protein [Parerythrobacter lacustris]
MLGQGPDTDYRAALAENRWHDGAAALAAAVREKPGDAGLARAYVRTLLLLGDGEGAAAAIDRMLEVQPDLSRSPEWIVFAAEADMLREQERAALASLEGIAGADAARVRALALAQLGRHDEADAELDAALEQFPADVRLNSDKALRLTADGNFAAAGALVDRALKSDASSLDAGLAKARLDEAMGNLGAAQGRLEKLGQTYPDSKTVTLARGRVLLAAGKIDDATSIVKSLREAGIDTPELTLLEAKVAARKGKWEDVRSVMQAREREMRDVPEAQLLYATALQELGLATMAEAILERVVDRYPEYHAARAQLAEFLLATGQKEKARSIIAPLRELAELPPPARELIVRVDAG